MVDTKIRDGCKVQKIAGIDHRIKRGTKLIVAGTANFGLMLKFDGIQGYHTARFFKRVITCDKINLQCYVK